MSCRSFRYFKFNFRTKSIMKNSTWIILSVLIGLSSPTYCGAENTAPEKSQVAASSQESRQIITIQVSSLKKAEDAEREMTRFKGLGLDVFKDYEPVKDKGMWHRLYIGRFESKNDATEYAKELVDRGIISGFWVKKKKVPIKIEKQPEADENEIQAPVAVIQSPKEETIVTPNELPAARVQTEVPAPSEIPESQKPKAADMVNDEHIPAEPIIVKEKTHSQANGKNEIGKRESRISLGLKASILYAHNADDFKVTRFDNTTEGESWTFVSGYGFVGLVGDLKVNEGWSVEASLEKDTMIDIDIWQFILGPKYEFRKIGFITPFARAGVVVGHLEWDDDLGSFDRGIGLDAGLGAVLTKSNFRFGLEVSLQRLRYNYNKPADDDIVSTEDYLDMSGIVLSGTITYLF